VAELRGGLKTRRSVPRDAERRSVSPKSSSPGEWTPQPRRSHGSSQEHTQPTRAPSCDRMRV
jgi:hypothetical protein